MLISDEGICTDKGNIFRNLARIKEVSKDATVVISIREQSNYLLSQYYQYRRGVFGNKDWRDVSIYEFLDNNTKNHVKDADYLPLVEEAIRIFGIDNIVVIPYEYMELHPNLYANFFSGIASDNDLKKIEKIITNSKKEHARDKRIFFSAISRILEKMGVDKLICRLPLIFHKLVYSHYTPYNIEIWMKSNGVSYSESNSKIEKLLGVDLKFLGYDCK